MNIMRKPFLKRIGFVLMPILFCYIDGTVRAQGPDTLLSVRSNADYIDPTIGNVGWLLEPTRPTVQMPNQLIRFTPDRKDYTDDQISGFPLTIVSHRLGQVFALKPSILHPDGVAWEEKQAYDHDLEVNRPWYYSTYLLDDEIRVEFTAGRKVGCFRFRFPPTASEKSLLFSPYNDGEAHWSFPTSTEVTGMETYNGTIKVYMYGVFSHPGTSSALSGGRQVYVQFPRGTDEVTFTYAISYIGPEQAKRNYTAEKAPFESLESSGFRAWQKVMDQIRVEGGTESQKRSFFTALYRCQERMVDITEDGQYYSGFDNQVHQDARPFYVDDWSWDTYLALHPLRMILHPAQEEDMLQSYVRMYRQSGWMPTFPVLFGDNPCMNGFHSTIIFLDAWRKGLRHFDVSTAYEGMRKNAVSATMLPWRNGDKTVLDDFYYAHGYFPALPPGEKETVPEVHPFEKRQAVAVTLGASYDDWALSQMAGELGKKDDETLFAPRGQNYKNLWSPTDRFFLPRDTLGNWIHINPAFDGGPGGRDYYDENNGWTYLWEVQEDIPGLVGLMGGPKAFGERLDQLFRTGLGMGKSAFWYKFPDASGLTGQHSMGNEPGFVIPYLYNFSDAPWKTQERVRYLLDIWFKDNVFGIPGDEDGGGMSAFVVFSSMGFYPVTPGLPDYTIGSPIFRKVSIALPGGKTFTVIAHHASTLNKYIQSATLDGKPLDTPWFTHAQLVSGGRLELEMGPKPNKKWGHAH